MSCCTDLSAAADWYDWEGAQPKEPVDLISNAMLQSGAVVISGARARTTDFASQTWIASPLSLVAVPSCIANGSDKGAKQADAAQWEFDHLTWNNSSSLQVPLQKVMFMRGGTEWSMSLVFTLSGASAPLELVQLGFRDNAGTRGDCRGTYPVIQFDATSTVGLSGTISLQVTLRQFGVYSVVLWARSQATVTPPRPSEYSMFEMEWIVVP